MSSRWSAWREAVDLEEYFSRWDQLAAAGRETHGEADFIASFAPSSVLDAGCGMGRVAIELDRRGIACDGVDLDDELLAYARRVAPQMSWYTDDLATMELERRYDVVAMPGNVMVFCRRSDRRRVVGAVAQHVLPGGLVIAGFQLERGSDAMTVDEYDRLCAECGLWPVERWATWEREPFTGGDYAVLVHRRGAFDH